MFKNPPLSTSVTEGEDVTFRCTAEHFFRPFQPLLTVDWHFTPSGSSKAVYWFNGTLDRIKNLTGIEMIAVSGERRSMLTFSGVRREADGGSVVCVVDGGGKSDPAILTVLCEYDL